MRVQLPTSNASEEINIIAIMNIWAICLLFFARLLNDCIVALTLCIKTVKPIRSSRDTECCMLCFTFNGNDLHWGSRAKVYQMIWNYARTHLSSTELLQKFHNPAAQILGIIHKRMNESQLKDLRSFQINALLYHWKMSRKNHNKLREWDHTDIIFW